MPFKSRVTTFSEVSRKLEQINKHLTILHAFLKRQNWSKVPKKPKNGGGDNTGTKPPKWPP
jgi:hypothetical protein